MVREAVEGLAGRRARSTRNTPALQDGKRGRDSVDADGEKLEVELVDQGARSNAID